MSNLVIKTGILILCQGNFLQFSLKIRKNTIIRKSILTLVGSEVTKVKSEPI